MNRTPCALVLALCALILGANTLVADTDPARVVVEAEPQAARVYLDPPSIEAREAGQNVTVSICIENVVHLYDLTVGLTWDPAVLEFVNLTEGGFLEPTQMISGTINSTTGEIYPPYGITCTTPPGWPVIGKSGNGILANVTFRAKAAGRFSVYLAEVDLGDDDPYGGLLIPAQVENVLMVGLIRQGVEVFYNITVTSNLTSRSSIERFRAQGYAFEAQAKEIRFSITSKPYQTRFSGKTYRPNDWDWVRGGLCKVSVPENLLRAPGGEWKVLLNGTETPYTATRWNFVKYPPVGGDEEEVVEPEPELNITMTTLSFNFTLGNYEVRIIGEAVGVATYTLPFVAGVVAAVALVAIVVLRHRL